MEKSSPTFKYDLFICHASEDKPDFVRPLADRLVAERLTVWYDEFALVLGDNLRQKVDEGLARSTYGLVVLSPAFFEKKWGQYELDGLFAREMAGEGKVILPVWHNVGEAEVRAHSASLAVRFAAKSSDGFERVVHEVLRAVSGAAGAPSPAQPLATGDVPGRIRGFHEAMRALGILGARLTSPEGAQEPDQDLLDSFGRAFADFQRRRSSVALDVPTSLWNRISAMAVEFHRMYSRRVHGGHDGWSRSTDDFDALSPTIDEIEADLRSILGVDTMSPDERRVLLEFADTFARCLRAIEALRAKYEDTSPTTVRQSLDDLSRVIAQIQVLAPSILDDASNAYTALKRAHRNDNDDAAVFDAVKAYTTAVTKARSRRAS